MRRPKLEKYISEKVLDDVLELMDEFGEFVSVRSEIKLCRDPKDNFLLSLAVDGKADYLLTGDNDLLVLKTIEETKIMKISRFLETEV